MFDVIMTAAEPTGLTRTMISEPSGAAVRWGVAGGTVLPTVPRLPAVRGTQSNTTRVTGALARTPRFTGPARGRSRASRFQLCRLRYCRGCLSGSLLAKLMHLNKPDECTVLI